jgi:hypothetical protein
MVNGDWRMDNLVYVEVLDNDEGSHEDLVFQIQGLTERLVFDSYYFALAIESTDDRRLIKHFLGAYLEAWVNEIKGMDDGDERVFPIDISDQYVGCMKVQFCDPQLKLTYGYSMMIEGTGMELIAPRKYFTEISDFKANTPVPLTIDRNSLIQSLSQQIERLYDDGPPFAIHH